MQECDVINVVVKILDVANRTDLVTVDYEKSHAYGSEMLLDHKSRPMIQK